MKKSVGDEAEKDPKILDRIWRRKDREISELIPYLRGIDTIADYCQVDFWLFVVPYL